MAMEAVRKECLPRTAEDHRLASDRDVCCCSTWNTTGRDEGEGLNDGQGWAGVERERMKEIEKVIKKEN